MRLFGGLLILGCRLVDALNVTVDGEGFLRFLKNGALIYQKEADLKVTKGRLTNQKGDPLTPIVHLPEGTENFSVDLHGSVWVSSDSKPLGQLVIANPKGKKKSLSHGVYRFEGPVKLGNPGEGEWGVIRLVKLHLKPSDGEKHSPSLPLDTVLEFKSEAEIDEEQFTLGQLVKNDPPDHLKNIVIGETPSFGAVRQLNRYQVESRMKIAGHNLRDFKTVFPSQIRVKRRSQPILHEQICEVALEAARKQLGEVELAPGYQPTVNAPLGELNLAVEGLKGYKNSWTATVGIYIDGKRFNGRNIQILRSGISTTLKIGNMVKVIFRSNGVLVETKGKLKKLNEREAHIEIKPNVIVEGTLKDDGSIEVIL